MATKLDQTVGTITSRPAAWNEWALSEDRVPLFSLIVAPVDDAGAPIPDAEPELVEYTMPKKPNPGLALRFLKMAREQGELATAWLIESAIGEDGYNALADELINYDGDATALLRGIVEKIQRVAMGGLEAPKA